MKIWSPDFTHEGPIPRRFTCQGQDMSPALLWSEIPKAAHSLALIVEDPDAPDPAAPRVVWVHWVLYNLSPSTTGLVQGARPQDLPYGTLEGTNDWKKTGYGGPCPPIGRHRYFFRLYALKSLLPDLRKPDKTRLLHAITSQLVEQAELMGTYEKGR